jgi:hypothetical protein
VRVYINSNDMNSCSWTVNLEEENIVISLTPPANKTAILALVPQRPTVNIACFCMCHMAVLGRLSRWKFTALDYMMLNVTNTVCTKEYNVLYLSEHMFY